MRTNTFPFGVAAVVEPILYRLCKARALNSRTCNWRPVFWKERKQIWLALFNIHIRNKPEQ